MAVRIRNSNGTWREAAAVRIRNSDGTWRFASTVRRKQSDGTWLVTWTALSVSPSTVNKTTLGSTANGTVTSDGCTVTGSTNVTWTQISGGAMTISNSAGTFVTWTATAVPSETTRSAVWRCTDNVTGATRDVSVNLTYIRNI